MEVKGDLEVLRSITARRADEQLHQNAALAAAYVIERHFAHWQRLTTDDLGVQDVVLPDATTLPEGWKIVIQNFGAVDALDVSYDDASSLYLVPPNKVYQFTLVDNATSNGTWHINYLEDLPNDVAPRYCEDFVIADFGVLTGGYHTLTVLQATHLRGADPIVQVMEYDGTDKDIVYLDRLRISNIGDVQLRVNGNVGGGPGNDGRFDGRICLV